MNTNQLLHRVYTLASQVNYHDDRPVGGYVDLADIAAMLLDAAHHLMDAHVGKVHPCRAQHVRDAQKVAKHALASIEALAATRDEMRKPTNAVTPPMNAEYFDFLDHMR
jgi:hypothetical protein